MWPRSARRPASDSTSPSRSSTSCALPGSAFSAEMICAARAVAMVPRRRPRSRASICSATSIVMYALLLATAISGPARTYKTSSASRLSVLPTTLVIAASRAPRCRASRAAARVSAVSPDWLIATAIALGSISGCR